MADNVALSTGALIVATKEDGNVQHQEVVGEFLSGGRVPLQVATIAPLPTESTALEDLLTALLIEQRITNELLYALTQTEVEPLDMLRAKYKDWPVTL